VEVRWRSGGGRPARAGEGRGGNGESLPTTMRDACAKQPLFLRSSGIGRREG
jgi:hypothetical protein